MASESSCPEIKDLVNQTSALGWIDTPHPLFSSSVIIEAASPSFTLIQYKYERLLDYCYTCGRVGHLSYSCLVDPRPFDHGRYDNKLKASSLNTSRILHQIQPRRQLAPLVGPGALATISVSIRPSSESTQSTLPGQSFRSCTSQPNSSRSFPSSLSSCTNHISLSLGPPNSAFIGKSPLVMLQPHPHNAFLILTNIEKLSSLKIHFPDNTWPPFPKCYSSSGLSLVPTEFSNS
ncbi:hypothetical protein FH972_005720 [Carpinus fangiana]|uniref:CCHC-type domain-containing protein n=1 Tax=Carpinus fangiana TaxID=176857 RepID=A0A5N6QTM0_9ROSI|nr:hypothetical protein FH972_005720 [Carpinus fangiana]